MNNFSMIEENLEIHSSEIPQSEGFSWTSVKNFTMVEENLEIYSSEIHLK